MAERRRRGRGFKLSPKVTQLVCDALSIGATRTLAAQYARISPSSLFHWIIRGQKEVERREAGEPPNPDEDRYVALLQSVEDAESNACITWLMVIEKAARSDPEWARYMLSTKHPEYRLSQRHEVTGADGEPLNIVIDWSGNNNDKDSDHQG